MLAVRQRAVCTARRARMTTRRTRQAMRSYASDHHHHDHDHHSPQVEESPGMALYIALGAIGFSMATYTVSRPGKDGELSSLAKWIDGLRADYQHTWEERNTLRTNIKDQAAADRHTFQTVEKSRGFELRMPELIDSGSPRNVPAGHYVNMDKVVEHYRKQHMDEEERKAKQLEAAKKE